MQLIKRTVGQGAANDKSDVALIQAILLKTIRPAAPADPQGETKARPAGPYLTGGYSGQFNPDTGAAISAFQEDKELLTKPRVQPGIVAPGDPTWEAMLVAIPKEFAKLRIFPGERTVWIEASQEEFDKKLRYVSQCTFTPAFRLVVEATITSMFKTHGIAISVDPEGDFRTFWQQYILLTVPNKDGKIRTKAGPGESAHNFGRAVDLGFNGFKWLEPEKGSLVIDGPWLGRMDNIEKKLKLKPMTLSQPFWTKLREAGVKSGGFPSKFPEWAHLQAFSDDSTSSPKSLANLLERSGTMQWSYRNKKYHCNLGLGDELVPVGTAAQIWRRQATITIAVLNRLRKLARLKQHQTSFEMKRDSVSTDFPVTQLDVHEMQRALTEQFELAEANWLNWEERSEIRVDPRSPRRLG